MKFAGRYAHFVVFFVAIQLVIVQEVAAEISCHATESAQVSSDKDSEIVLSVEFDNAIQGPTAFVYVKGALAGAIPAAVVVPLESDGVPIEIGLPFLRPVPLYSLVVGPNELKWREAKVAVSEFAFEKVEQGNVWSSVTLGAERLVAMDLTETGDDFYALVLPAEAYNTMAEFSRTHKLGIGNPQWLSEIPQDNVLRASAAPRHVTYNQVTMSMEHLPAVADAKWSGSIEVAGWPGSFLEKRDWDVKSEPPGAEVRSIYGREGITRTLIEKVARVQERHIVVKKDGYLDCPQSACDKSESGRTVELRCYLPKSAR